METIYCNYAVSDHPITAEVDRSDPGRPCVRLEAGCNEFWMDVDEAQAVLEYLQRTLPTIQNTDT